MKNILKASLLLILFASCQKELEVDKTEEISFLIKTATETRNGVSVTTNFSYDPEGRVINTTSTSGENRVYKYGSDSYGVTIYNNTLQTGTESYFLNKLPFVDSAVYAGKIDTTARKYIYNTGRLLIQVKDYSIKNGQSILTKTTTAEYDANGNVSREYNTNNNQISYTYTNFLYNLDAGLIYFTHNRDLIKTSTFSGYLNTVLTSTYTFDNNNRITSETVVNESGTTVVAKVYTY